MTKNIGVHVIADLKNCDREHLNDKDFLVSICQAAIKEAHATLLNISVHQFKPQGITVVATLAESHLSLHSYPELGTACVDCFTCNPEVCRPEAGMLLIVQALDAEIDSLTIVERGKNWRTAEKIAELQKTSSQPLRSPSAAIGSA